MVVVYGENGPVYYQIKFWGWETMHDVPKRGRLIENIIKTVKDLVLTDGRVGIWVIARGTGISQMSVFKTLHKTLGMSKMSSTCRQQVCKVNLTAFINS